MSPPRGARLGEAAQGLLLRLFLGLIGTLPLDLASGLGGWIARSLGPRLRVSRRARRNLALVLPELGAAAHDRIIRQMWDNLGRVVFEYPHLARMRCFGQAARVAVTGTEHVDAALARGKPLIFVSGHLGNWELGGLAAAQYGLRVAEVYRAANNPAVERVMLSLRTGLGLEAIPKGAAGARRILAALKERRTLLMLIDQKMNDGIAVPFMGRRAMTAPAAAELALRTDATLLPAHITRVRGAHFRLEIEPPLALPTEGDRQARVRETMALANRRLEAWIRADPGQWFWLHRRWPES